MHAVPAPPIVCLLTGLLLAGCGSQSTPRKSSAPPPQKTVVRAETSEDAPPQPSAEVVTAADPEPYIDAAPAENLRPDDLRPQHDAAALAEAGIHLYESKRLKLYTDIDPDVAQTLPPLADKLYDALVEYFGPLPPDRQGGEFQMTGYLMRDEELFRENGLMEGLPLLFHGKHQANRFWMREQNFDYYRRHLLLHECTHCYMTFVPGPVPPVWYMEGMAELFGTHRIKQDGSVEFRILPTYFDEVGGWGRIEAIRKECAAGRPLTMVGVYDLPVEKFFKPEAYAWSWGLCHFLDSHPRYSQRFRRLGRHLHDGEFDRSFHQSFSGDARDLSTEWTLHARDLSTEWTLPLQPGYDTTRAAIEFQKGKALAEGESRTATIHAARGWQDVGLRVEAGQSLEITAEGRFTLANDPKPWISEPQGISFRYFNGIPLGRLVAYLDADPTEDTKEAAATHLLHIDQIGKSARLTMPANGRLLLRLNDAWDSLADNDGSVEVTIRRAVTDPP